LAVSQYQVRKLRTLILYLFDPLINPVILQMEQSVLDRVTEHALATPVISLCRC